MPIRFFLIAISSRFISAFLSILLIPLIYLVGKKLGGKTLGILTSFFCAVSVGFIQFAHFGTVEIWLTFLSLLFFYFSLETTKKITIKIVIASSVILGLLFGTKISSLVLFPLLFFLILKNAQKYKKIVYLFLSFFIIISVLFLISPFFVLDSNSFRQSMQYESSVALGTLPVFYTGEFFNSLPVVFQLTKIILSSSIRLLR